MKNIFHISLITRSLILGFITIFALFYFSIKNHVVDYATGSSDPVALQGSAHTVSIKYDYGFPLRIYNNTLKFGAPVYPNPYHPDPQWKNILINFAIYTIMTLLVFTIIKYLGGKPKINS